MPQCLFLAKAVVASATTSTQHTQAVTCLIALGQLLTSKITNGSVAGFCRGEAFYSDQWRILTSALITNTSASCQWTSCWSQTKQVVDKPHYHLW